MALAKVNIILKSISKHLSSVLGIHPSRVRITVSPPQIFDWFNIAVSLIPKAIHTRREEGSEGTAGGNIGSGTVMPIVELHFACVLTTFEYLDEQGVSVISFDDDKGHFYYVRKVFQALNGAYIMGQNNSFLSCGSIAVLSIDPIGRVVVPPIDRRKDTQINRGQIESVFNCYVAFLLDSFPGSIHNIIQAVPG